MYQYGGLSHHQFITQPAHREKELRIGRVKLDAGAQAPHQVFDLVVKNAAGFIFWPDGMADIISRSKLVLNLSKTDLTETSLAICSRQCPDYVSYKFQLKARPFMAGLCKTACISEQAPALSLIFSEEEVPTFRTKSECLVMIRKVLHDEARCEHHAQRLHEKVIGHYEDRVLMKQLCPNIVKRSDPICHAAQLPRWYRRRVAVAQRKYRRLRDFAMDEPPFVRLHIDKVSRGERYLVNIA